MTAETCCGVGVGLIKKGHPKHYIWFRKEYVSNPNVMYIFDSQFIMLNKGTYLIKHHISGMMKKKGTYMFGACIRRIEHHALYDRVIWEKIQYKYVTVDDTNVNTVLLIPITYICDIDVIGRNYRIESGFYFQADGSVLDTGKYFDTSYGNTSTIVTKIE